MGIYSSFDIGQMLNAISRHANDVKLTSTATGTWVLEVHDAIRGDIKLTGTLFQVVMKAFKSYKAAAQQERAEFSKKIALLNEPVELVQFDECDIPY